MTRQRLRKNRNIYRTRDRIKRVLWNRSLVARGTQILTIQIFPPRSTIYLTYAMTLHSAVVAFYAIKLNSCTFQVAVNGGSLLRSNGEQAWVHACTRILRAYTSVFTLVSTDTNASRMQLAALTRIWLETGSLVRKTRDLFSRSFTRFRSALDSGSFNVKSTIDSNLSRCFRYIGSLIIGWQHRGLPRLRMTKKSIVSAKIWIWMEGNDKIGFTYGTGCDDWQAGETHISLWKEDIRYGLYSRYSYSSFLLS